MAHNNRYNQNQPPIDFNALGQMNLGALLQMLSSIDPNQLLALLSQLPVDPNDPNFQLRPDDPRLGLLYSLRAMLPPENAHIVDDVIKKFNPQQPGR